MLLLFFLFLTGTEQLELSLGFAIYVADFKTITVSHVMCWTVTNNLFSSPGHRAFVLVCLGKAKNNNIVECEVRRVYAFLGTNYISLLPPAQCNASVQVHVEIPVHAACG